ncbi:Endothelin-converting enzyme [Penicillium ucsense]|uniref:Endothelin-converting enzyme n=1 Tax=Penicillium ucsense TaxID=2839758 RepID=A0A8J8WHZ2_9EURO|nr:Endothelin-converting enzyme [Penicillium ucsense]KAF7733020.1 Endothelin-converting enzyme [Penicillium ucsense]
MVQPPHSNETKEGMKYMASAELEGEEAYGHEDGYLVDKGFVQGAGAPRRCCKQRSRLRVAKRVGAIGCVGLLAYAFLQSFYGTPDVASGTPSGSPESSKAICQTPECVHAASEILYSLDPNYKDIDPCTNFDQYVCGGWRERHDMRADQGSIFAGTIMVENSQTRLRHILERSDAPAKEDAENFGKLKAGYEACLNESAIRDRGIKPLTNLLGKLQDVYSMGKTDHPTSHAELTDAIIFLMKSGAEAFVSPGVSPDDRDPDNVTIFVSPPRRIGLPAREYYNNTETVADYTDALKLVLKNFGGNNKIAKEIVALEKQLADITPDTAAQEDITKYYNPRSIKETEAMLPEISLKSIIKNFAPRDFKTDRLIVGSPSYMKKLSAILHDTSRETVSFFLQWKLIQTYSDSIEDEAIAPLRRFNNKLAGKDPQATEERWRKCIDHLDSSLGWSISRFYVLDSFSEESKQLGDQIITDIKERFSFTLTQTPWMSPDVRKLGIEKVQNIVQKIGYPTKSPNVLDAGDVEKYYESLKISHDQFFENELAVAKFDLEREWSKLGKPTDRDEWDMSAPTVNAYYNPPGNEIVFPAGIMQPPVFFGPDAPLYLAYGAFGAVSGHELSHAFDSTGRHYDETGNYTNWWDDETVKAFEDRAQCFVDQYSAFTVEGPGDKVLHVNGRLTLGENIADAGGLTAAYHAWKKRDSSKPDPALPGLDGFSKEQLFFISYSNWWCGKTTKQAAEQAIYNDPHAPKSARIIETMANSREFKDAFSCPDKKPVCKIW